MWKKMCHMSNPFESNLFGLFIPIVTFRLQNIKNLVSISDFSTIIETRNVVRQVMTQSIIKKKKKKSPYWNRVLIMYLSRFLETHGYFLPFNSLSIKAYCLFYPPQNEKEKEESVSYKQKSTCSPRTWGPWAHDQLPSLVIDLS